jgi:16S rRNA (cytosine967-C5)-methyltransferase
MPAQKTPNARNVARQVIDRTLQGAELQAALHRQLNSQILTEPDRHLTTQLVYGYFRLQFRLECIISRLLTKKKNSLPGSVFRLLCLGAYEICFLSRIPDFATVHWYVQHIKTHFTPRLAGLANAVLRRVCREKEDFLQRDFYAWDRPDRNTFLARYFSCPTWIVGLCLDAFGPEKGELVLSRCLHPPPVGLRFHPGACGWTELYAHLASRSSPRKQTFRGLALESAPDREIRKAETQGLLTRQSLAAQQALERVDPASWPRPVWDACAGRGLKTGQLLEEDCSPLWASDIHARKIVACRSELTRLHLPQIPLFVSDAARPPLGRTKAYTILLDVPCSGLGVLSRRPDIKAKRRPEDILSLISLQSSLLTSCLSILPPGGRLIYMSCTFNPDENQNLVHQVLKQHPGKGRLLDLHLPNPESVLGEYFFTACISV